ncbi:MAG: aryl sulfotransferase [Candidatus Azotimanducaceae bacterium]|jgi:aryl sulfotransferase
MKQDLSAYIAGLANIIGIKLDGAQLDATTQAATFENMQAKGGQFAPGSGTGMWKNEADFFANGKNSRWKGELTPAELKLFDERIATLLSEDQRAWLLRS